MCSIDLAMDVFLTSVRSESSIHNARMATKNTMSDRNLVSKGTSSDDTPTPGFVLKELVSREVGWLV